MGVETQGKGRQSLTHSLLCSNHPYYRNLAKRTSLERISDY